MFYSEFVVGERQSIREIQRAHIRDTITELLKGIVEDLDKPDSLGSSGLSESDPSSTAHQISAPENEPTTSAETESMTTMAFNGEIRPPQNFDGSLGAEEAALNPSNSEGHVGTVAEESIKKIRQLGEGGMTMTVATEFVHGFKVITLRIYPLIVLR
jgi:hypothetical protein